MSRWRAEPERAALAALVVAALLAPGCGTDGRAAPARSGSSTVAAVTKGVSDPFFADLDAGLVAAARRHRTRLDLAGVPGLFETDAQASKLAARVGRPTGCFVVDPITPTNLLPALVHVPRGTPIVDVESPVARGPAVNGSVHIATFVEADNVLAGERAAAAMARFVPRGSEVAVIGGIPDDPRNVARTRGFMLGARGRFTVVQTVAADFERRSARLAAGALLRAHPRIRGLLAAGDQMALGAAEAVGAAGRRGGVAVVGIDGTRPALAAIRRGALSATVAEYPAAMGRLGLEACLVALRRRRLPARIETPVEVVTRANVAAARARYPQPAASIPDPLAPVLAR